MSVAELLREHAAQAPALPGAEGWLAKWRADQLKQFKRLGFPSPRDEHWRYTDAGRLLPAELAPAARSTDQVDAPEPLVAGYQVVLHNGHFCPQSSRLPEDQNLEVLDLSALLSNSPERLKPLTDQDPAADGFAALAQAFLGSGVAIFTHPDTQLDAPLEILHLSDAGSFAQPVVYLEVAPHSRLCVIERWHSANAGFHNSLRDLHLAKGAHLDYHAAQLGGQQAMQVARLHARLQADSRLHCHTASLGGRWLRNTLAIELAGRGAHCELLGLACGGGKAYRDNHIHIRHATSDCTSDQQYKYVLDDEARGVFCGHVEVAPDAQHTAAEQNNRAMLLSPSAEMNSKPQLEIYADDVKCAHGAAFGELDAEALFYLRSRGLTEAQARTQLIFGFIHELLAPLTLVGLRETLHQHIVDWLASGGRTA